MRILGLAVEHDSGVAYVDGGKIVYAANEERFDRKKFTRAFPAGSIHEGEKTVRGFAGKAERVAVGSRVHVTEDVGGWHGEGLLARSLAFLSITRLDRFFFGTHFGVSLVMLVMRIAQLPERWSLKKSLRAHGVNAPVSYIDHHTAHAASAYFTSPWRRALVVTLDAQGDGFCSRVFMGEAGALTYLQGTPFFHSPGNYYAYVTLQFGFKFGREGKVTGLAARGNPEKTVEIFRSRLVFDEDRCTFNNKGFYRHPEMEYLKQALKGFSREDIAAGVQKHLEEVVVAYIQALINKYSRSRIPVVLAGGVFANVRLNECLLALPEVSGVYIYPHMGDGGLAAGAALAIEAKGKKLEPKELHDAYLGPDYSDEEILDALQNTDAKFRKSDNLAEETARLLAEGKIVAVSRGRMEYGPRALGNRSILSQATDPDVNDWLNKKLVRSEFMPFAPILLKDRADKYFEDYKKCEKALEFMTITLHAKPVCRKEAPAVVHVDNTARPQIVTDETNPFIADVLRDYEKRTGLSVLINTSFNMHEEPIVASPSDSLRAFFKSELDALVLGSYIIERA
jgi:carbamoyltransferase